MYNNNELNGAFCKAQAWGMIPSDGELSLKVKSSQHLESSLILSTNPPTFR